MAPWRARDNWFERHPKITIGLIIFLATVVVDIVAANVLIALNLYTPQRKIETYYRIKHDVYHHSLAPNISYSEGRWGPIGYRIDTNSLGFKDRSARQVPLSSDKYRIVFIGDSFTEGAGIEYKDTFVGIVDSRLSEKHIETLNAAVSSYSPIIYLRKVEHLLNDVQLDFDHLVVLLDLSDIIDDAKVYTYDELGNVVLQSPPGLDESIKHFITENTVLLSNLRILMRKLKKSTRREKTIQDALNRYRGLWTIDANAYEEYAKAGLAKSAGYMDELSGLLKDHGIKLSIAVYPWPDQIVHRDLRSRQVQFWEDWAGRHGVQFINLFPVFISDRAPNAVIEQFFIKGDVHWNKAGHALVADRLWDQLDLGRVSR